MFEGQLLNPRQIRGYDSVAIDGGNIITGDSRYGRVFRTSSSDSEDFELLFETDIGPVYSLLNLSDQVNLAAIGNKLYIVHCGELDIEEEEETTTTTTLEETTTTTTETGAVTVTFPIGGEVFTFGQTITITWSSTLGISEVVSIDLLKGEEVALVINPRTSNDGSYEWIIPAGLLPGDDYSISVTWLTAGDPNPANSDSSGNFTLTSAESTTTTTTTDEPTEQPSSPVSTICRGIPILELPENEHIVDMVEDEGFGRILFITSGARVLSSTKADINAYLTGDRKIYGEVKDGFGIQSQTVSTQVLYALYKRIAEINQDKEITKWTYEEDPSAIKSDRLEAVFLSPVIQVKEDLGFWKDLLWREDKYDDTELLICVRAGATLEEMQAKPWDNCYISRDSDSGYGTTGVITRNLLDSGLEGQFLQFKVVMTTDAKDISPALLDLSITYSTKFALYFFTTKFSLVNNADAKVGLLVANMTEPLNTEIRFGVVNTNSADWNDYEVISPDKFFTLDSFENIKVGIKMISYSENIPEVAEFALMNGADKDTTLNE
jgi:hypothetical protein